jgi:zinc protease
MKRDRRQARMARMARASLVCLASACSACGSAGPLPPPPKSPLPVKWPEPLTPSDAARTTPDAPFRERMPEAGPPITWTAPKIESFTLKNGIRVLFAPRHELPVVSVRVVARAGAGDVVGERPGAFAFMGAMLEQGTMKRSALAISDAYEGMGASHGAWVDWDAGQVTVKVLASELEKGLDLLSDVTIRPSFPQAEIDRVKARWLASIQAEKTSPTAMASNALAATLYGRAHPYGHSLFGKEEDVKGLSRSDITRAYGRELTPTNVTLVAAGDVTHEALADLLEGAFGAWKAGAATRRGSVGDAKGEPSRLVLVDRPGAPQSQILVAEQGVSYATPDRDALAVMNAILGGMFSSHINLNLREAHAYTYDARSRFALRHGSGPFTAGGAVVADKTAAAIEELLREVGAIREKEVTAEELADAKEYITLGMPGRFETVSDVTSALAELAIYDLPLDEYAKRPARIAAISAADVKRVAQAHLHPAKLKVIVVGDRARVEPTLEALKLGPPDVRDAYGDRVTAAPPP